MNNDLFERLLFEDESTTLDFKKEQYRFAKATDDEKSELLKDILGFSNAWRRSEAYILIGVEDVRGGRSNVVGISATGHPDGHSLQQFVNSLTNQPVRFHYEAFGYEGKQVGIICIDEQTRPIYLKHDYGKLSKEKVYVRRGSSTDPTKPALPEEIAQMRVGSDPPAAELVVEFAEITRDDARGTDISLEAEFCEMPAVDSIPDFAIPGQEDACDFPGGLYPNRANVRFFRELASFEVARRLFRPIRLVVKNIGQVAADNVRAEMTMPTNMGAAVLYASEMPDPPKRHRGLLDYTVPKGIRPVFLRYPGMVTIDKNEERFRVEIDCGNLQPGRRVWSDIFYLGMLESGALPLCGLLFADNLPQPKNSALTISVSVKRTGMTVDELCSLPELAVENEG